MSLYKYEALKGYLAQSSLRANNITRPGKYIWMRCTGTSLRASNRTGITPLYNVQWEIARRQLHTLLLDAESVPLLINVTAFL